MTCRRRRSRAAGSEGTAARRLVDRHAWTGAGRSTSRPGGRAGRAPSSRHHSTSTREGGLVGDAAGLLEPDRGRGDRLVRAALGGQRHPGRRADEDRLPARVDPERPRLEGAGDERVVEHADRQQRLAPARSRWRRARRAGRPGWSRRCPARCAGRSAARASAGSSRRRRRTSRAARAPTTTPTLFTQPPRLVRRADVGADRDDPAGGVGGGAGEVEQRAAQRLPGCGRCRWACGRGPSGTAGGGAGTAAARRSRAAVAAHRSAAGGPAAKRRPRVVEVGAQAASPARASGRR